MSRWLKLLIGLAASLLAAWLSYGPLGRGAAFVDGIETHAKAVLAPVLIPGVAVEMRREPLSRVAILCGPTNDFQRGGINDMPGLDGRIASVAGISGVRWQRPPATPNGPTPACVAGARPADEAGIVPLIAEYLGLAALAWLIGLGIGWLLFRPRRKREGYL